jgi:hypothetical protein
LFNRALSANEIAALYAAGSAGMCKPAFPPPAGLVSWWQAEGNALDTAGGHHGYLELVPKARDFDDTISQA